LNPKITKLHLLIQKKMRQHLQSQLRMLLQPSLNQRQIILKFLKSNPKMHPLLSMNQEPMLLNHLLLSQQKMSLRHLLNLRPTLPNHLLLSQLRMWPKPLWIRLLKKVLSTSHRKFLQITASLNSKKLIGNRSAQWLKKCQRFQLTCSPLEAMKFLLNRPSRTTLAKSTSLIEFSSKIIII